MIMISKPVLALLSMLSIASAAPLATCPGYRVTNVQSGDSYLVADLTRAGTSCNLYSEDITNLRLTVEYQTDTRLHVLIEDREKNVYQIQDNILPRPASQNASSQTADLRFSYEANPFSFKVTRASTGDVLFDTSPSPLIFETQYLRLRTRLPPNPNLYGLGEHSDSFRLPTDGYKRTLWNSEAPYIPQNQNLYGSHPVYFEHRSGSGSGSDKSPATHCVFLRSAAGMDIIISKSDSNEQYLEYNTIGGVFDFYFISGGPDGRPEEVSKQYAQVVGLPAMMPYWSLGFHQCKYGWPDLAHVKQVVANYSAAGIPLEAVWDDIDYMDNKLDFSTDPVRYPKDQLGKFVDELHGKDMRYVQILDPGIRNKQDYGPFKRGADKGVFLKAADGSWYRGLQWPGEVVWPDWIAPQTKEWWTTEILTFYDPNNGIDIDGLWIDMNEASNMCADTMCLSSAQDMEARSVQVHNQTPLSPRVARAPGDGQHLGLPNRDLFTPQYQIANHYPTISSRTLFTNITNADGTTQYDTHNLHGLFMSLTTHSALVARSPTRRPFLLTRSTFSGSSRFAAHWFGDNFSSWADYRASIRQLLSFSSIHNYPMVGSDVCGFNGQAQERMCARWAVLGAWHPFYRNHADVSAPDQEFYRWGSVADAARGAVATRYRLLDYFYTGLYYASTRGEVLVRPLWFQWPGDGKTYGIDTQFLLGDSLLVNPVVEDDTQSVSFYLPQGIWYDFFSHDRINQSAGGQAITVTGVDWDEIPVYIRGGSIIPLRLSSPNSSSASGSAGEGQAMTTKEVRARNFEIIVAPDVNGKASGKLYLDDGESLDSSGKESEIEFSWDGSQGKGKLEARGTFGYETEIKVVRVVVVGDAERKAEGEWGLMGSFTVDF